MEKKYIEMMNPSGKGESLINQLDRQDLDNQVVALGYEDPQRQQQQLMRQWQ